MFEVAMEFTSPPELKEAAHQLAARYTIAAS
jgi:hypothetical protein